MRHTFQKLGLVALALLAGAGAAKAEDSRFTVDFKLRLGHQLNSNQDKLDKRMLGAGLSLGYQLPYGCLNTEVGFQYKSGKQYLNGPGGMDIAAGQTVDWSISPDSRKSQMDGLTFRLSYSMPLPVENLSLQAGVQAGGTRFRQEYFGDVGNTNWTVYEDTYVGEVHKSDIGASVSPFVGVSYRIDASSSFELNVLVQRYKSINYRHVAGTVPGSFEGNTAMDYTVLNNRTAPHLEIGYSFRF